MNRQFIVSIVGPDRAGLLKYFAAATHERGGKWLHSKVIRLDGQFAAIIKIELPESQVQVLKSWFEAQEAYLLVFSEVVSGGGEDVRAFKLQVDAEDRPGLVNDITHVLLENQIKIADMACHRVGVADLGASVFTSEFELKVPGDVDLGELTLEIEALGGDIRANIEDAAAL